MNIETIFNNAEDKEVSKYILYVAVSGGSIADNSNLFVDKNLTKKVDASTLKKIFYKGLIVQGIDSDTKEETYHTFAPIAFVDKEASSADYNMVICLDTPSPSSITPIMLTSGEFGFE